MDIMLERILSLIPKKDNGDFVHGAIKEFAQSIGLKSGNLISDWISGRSTSYLKKVDQISNVYGVSVEWLRGETDQKEKPAPTNGDGLSPAKQKLLAAIDDLSDEQCYKLLGIIEEAKKLL